MKNLCNILILLIVLIGFFGTYQCKKIKKQPQQTASVNSQCIEAFMKLRAQEYSAVTFKIINNNEIVVGETFGSGDINFEQLIDRFSNSQPIFALYYISERRGYVFILFIPDSARVSTKMLYSAAYEIIRSQIYGVSRVFRSNQKDELLWLLQKYTELSVET